MKIGVCGHFGGKDTFLDGQTVKTKNVYEALCSHYGSENIKIVDTYKIKKRFVSVFWGTLRLFFLCNSIVMLPAQNGIGIFAPLFVLFKKIFKKQIYYCVIGGWLPIFLSDKSALSDKLKTFDGIFVETKTMKNALDSNGFDNVIVLSNFKKLDIIDECDIPSFFDKPYKLCTFSRVMKEKGIETAIEAVKKANSIIGSEAFSLDIYGQIDDGYITEFTSIIQDLPEYIKYRGLVPFDESTVVLRSCFALLFPTYYHGEGFAGTLLDAFASGLPVIASDWKYNPELVTEDVGIIFESKNSDALCSILVDIYYSEYDLTSMRFNCVKKAHQFSFENAAKTLSDRIG